MVQLAIRCHPRVPVSGDELEEWLGRQTDELRVNFPQGIVRLSRLLQGREAHLDVGWLIELELDEESLADGRLADVLRDMRLLGLQPTLLAPRISAMNGRAS